MGAVPQRIPLGVKPPDVAFGGCVPIGEAKEKPDWVVREIFPRYTIGALAVARVVLGITDGAGGVDAHGFGSVEMGFARVLITQIFRMYWCAQRADSIHV